MKYLETSNYGSASVRPINSLSLRPRDFYCFTVNTANLLMSPPTIRYFYCPRKRRQYCFRHCRSISTI